MMRSTRLTPRQYPYNPDDLTRDMTHHHRGRDHLIASTEGNVAIDGHEEARFGLNVYR